MSKTIIAIIIIIIVAGLGYWIYQSTLTPEGLTEKEQACVNSGGTISTSLCCKSTSDFPNLCLIGPCGCSPDNSHEIKICDCGPDKCFDGNECITIEEETADWKTYRNEEYGFEIRYPPEYDVDNQSRWQDKKTLAIIGHFPNGFSISISDSPAIFYYPERDGFIYGSKIEDMYREYKFDFFKRIKKRKINNISFTIAYGVIMDEYRYVDAITQDSSHKYYVVLQQAGEIEDLPPGLWENLHCMPDEAEKWIINRSFEWIIRKMIEEEYEDVTTFNKILSTFRFLE